MIIASSFKLCACIRSSSAQLSCSKAGQTPNHIQAATLFASSSAQLSNLSHGIHLTGRHDLHSRPSRYTYLTSTAWVGKTFSGRRPRRNSLFYVPHQIPVGKPGADETEICYREPMRPGGPLIADSATPCQHSCC